MAFNRSRVSTSVLQQFSHNREMQRFLINLSTSSNDTSESEEKYRTVYLIVSDIHNPSELGGQAGNFNGSLLVAIEDQFHTLYAYDSSVVAEQSPLYVSGSVGTWVAITSNAFTVGSGKVRLTSADSPYTAAVSDDIIFCDTDGGNIVLNMPSGDDITTTNTTANRKIINTGTSGNTVAITPNGTEKFYGVAGAFTLYDYENVDVDYDSTEGWF